MDPEKLTVIDGPAAVEGKLTGKDARILGRFKGEAELQGRLVIGEGARVEARIHAEAVEIAGEFEGEVVARSLQLLERARVRGTLDAQVLAVREGAVLNGSITAADKGRREPVVPKSPTPPKAAEPKPAELKPAAAQPVQSKPAEPKPGEPKAAEPRAETLPASKPTGGGDAKPAAGEAAKPGGGGPKADTGAASG